MISTTTRLKTKGRRPAADQTPADQTDEQLLLEYRESGNRDLFSELVHRYERELYGYLRRYLGDAEMAEDAFQTTFLQVHLKCDSFQSGRKVRPWLYTVATNQAIDTQRRNRRHRLLSLDRAQRSDPEDLTRLIDLLVSDETDPATVAGNIESGQWVRESVGQLPDHMRAVVDLVYYRGMKYREAADVLAVPVGTVKSRLHSAILKLNEAWHGTHQPCEC